MRKSFLLGAVVLLSLAGAANAQQVKVMQWNVRGNLGTVASNDSFRAKAIARIINYAQPDIITFNELNDNGPIDTAAGVIDWVTNNLSYFGNQTGVTFWVDIATVGDGFIRNGSISRYPISGAYTYSDGGNTYANLRGMESFKVQLGGTNILEVFHVHLKCCSDGSSCLRRQEEAGVDATNMMNWAAANSFPYVFTGDCNEDDDPNHNFSCAPTSTYHPLPTLKEGAGLVDYNPTTLSGARETWSTSGASIRFDYILGATNRPPVTRVVTGFVFSSSDWADHGLYTNAGTLNSAFDSQSASDHYNVMVTYYFPTSDTNFNVTTDTAFASSGGFGGPFSPSSHLYTLNNTDTIPLFWSVTTTASWLTVSSPATNSDLGIGQSTNVTVSINSVANSLSAGTYVGTINFSNTATGVSIPITVALAVGSIPPVASFTGSPTNGPALLAVTFTDTSTGSITNRFWDFGDGGTTNITATTISHKYAEGTYTVTLVETGPGGVSTNTQVNLIAASAAPLYTISTSASPSGGGTTGGDGTYTNGVTATVTATANACYSFVNWTEGGTSVSLSPNYPFTVVTNRTLVANFAPISYTIAANSSPSDGGTTSGGGTYACGSNVTVCATANSCYSFVNWTVDTNVVSTSACYSFTAAGNQTVVANFAVNGGPSIGSLTPLHAFVGTSDGTYPVAGLVQLSDGNLYGTTYSGGANYYGTVFRISPSGSLALLHSFGPGEGTYPYAGVVQGSNGDFYGTTAWGGTNDAGTVFRISPNGSLTTLWLFTGGSDGTHPYSGVVQGSNGDFYGTTAWGGASGNGTVFRISPTGSLTTLYSFTGGSDGYFPWAGLVQGSDGNFYGTTYGSGSGPNGYGSVFRISPSGSLTNLWRFTNGLDGATPWSGLVQGIDGNFYGTTTYGGTSGRGVLFKLSVPLNPPTDTIATSSSPSAGGSTSGAGSYTNGAAATMTATANACYSFVNWTEGGTAVSTSASYSFIVGTNRTLVANFVPVSSYTINTSSSPSGAGTTIGDGTYICGSNVTVCATANSCYGFVNWTDQNSNVVSTAACYTFTPASDQALVANFALITYMIVANASPSGGGSTSGGGAYACGSNVTVCATANACYSFVNWTDQNSNVVSTAACYTFTANANRNLVANFAPYTISTTSSSTNGGTTSGGGIVNCESNVTVCATPNSFYAFVSWTEDGNVVSTTACYSFTATGSRTLVANFVVTSVTITADAGDLRDQWGDLASSNSVAVLVVDTGTNGFTDPQPGFPLSPDATWGTDDKVVGLWDLTAIAADYGDGQLFDQTVVAYTNGIASGQRLQLYWFPSLTLASNTVGVTYYGKYADTNSPALDESDLWQMPADLSNVHLKFWTARWGGSNPQTAGWATNLTVQSLSAFQAWQMQYFNCTNCPNTAAAEDFDGDGQSNESEFWAGTDPTNSASVFRIVEIAPLDEDMLLTWTTVGGNKYAVQTATGDATNSFVELAPVIIAPGTGESLLSVIHLGAATNGASRFYRIRLVP